MKKIQKGQNGYLKYQRKIVTLRTVGLFAIAFAILIVGLCTTGTKSNAMTVVAILGMLPASKSAVNMIMFFRFKDSSPKLHERSMAIVHDLPMQYDLVFTMPDKSYQIQQLACNANTICGYRDGDAQSLQKLQEHIKVMLEKDSLKNVEVKLWNDYGQFEKRLQQMQDKYAPAEDSQSNQILSLLLAISL